VRRLLATFVVVLACGLGAAARAAPLDFALTNAGGGNWIFSVNNTSGKGIGSLAFLTDPGFTSVVFEPTNTGISVPDSVLTIDPLGTGQNFLVVNNIAGQTIAPTGATTRIGTLIATSPLSGTKITNLLFLTYNIDIPSVNDVEGNPFPESDILWDPGPPYVPEPASTPLLGIAACALALLRR